MLSFYLPYAVPIDLCLQLRNVAVERSPTQTKAEPVSLVLPALTRCQQDMDSVMVVQ